MSMARLIVFCLIMAHALSISAAAAEATSARKLGKHAPSPAAEAPGVGESGGALAEEAAAESSHLSPHRHHHGSSEKSFIGGCTIVGILGAVFLTAVFCYIRATRRRPVQPCSPTHESVSSMEERKMIGSASPSVNK